MVEINIDNDLTQINQQLEDLVAQFNQLNSQREQLSQQIHNLNGIAMFLRGKQQDPVEEVNAEDLERSEGYPEEVLN